MERKTREELNRLSKEVFGKTSRWQKIVNNGVAEPHQREREVMVPTTKGIVKKIFTDNKNITKRYSVEEVRQLMLDILEARTPALVKAEPVAEEATESSPAV